MALTYYAGDYFVGLSGDTKPTGCQDGARFDESDTLLSYLKVSGSWLVKSAAITQTSFSYSYFENYLATGNITSGTSITIPNSKTYVTGANTLSLYVNGIRQRKNTSSIVIDNDYWETASSGVYLTYAIPSGSLLTFDIISKT